MADQILSQEEIDALLGAMAKGEVDLSEEKTQGPRVEPYDLTSQRIMMRDEFFALSEVYDKFSGLLQGGIASMFQRSMEVRLVSTEMVKFGEFIKAFSNPTSFNIFSMEPLIGAALMAVEADLAFSLIDCMFGGDGKPLSQSRDFSLIEQRMLGKFANETLTNFEKAWEFVFPVKILLKKAETKSEFVHMVNPNDQVIVIVFSLNGKEFSGNLYICISYLMLEPIKEKLSTKYLREKDMAYAWRYQLETLLEETPVELVAELGRTVQSVRNLLDLDVDDVLKLNVGPDDPVAIRIGNISKFNGFPGVAKGNRAVEITRMLMSQGEII
ncbi:MAG: flagellar motor switch protein FliM [Desulfatirhabdiaceae bacterium]